MKILEINTEKTWRGGERQTCYNTIGLNHAGFSIELLCRRRCPLSLQALAQGIRVHETGSGLGAILFLVFKARRYQIIHAQTAKTQFYAVLTKIFHRRPIVYTRRLDFVPNGLLTKLKYLLTDRVVAISGPVKKILEEFGIQSVTIISDAISNKELHKERAKKFLLEKGWSGKKIIATTAALVPHKDPLTMVKTIQALAEKRSDFIFLHFGQGELEDEVQKKIEELGLNDCYKLIGFVDAVEDFFPVFDVFVMSSQEEGLGSSVLDAFLYKVPVASTNAGGLKEIVKEKGLLCPIRDSTSLASNIDLLLSDAVLREKLTQQAHEYVLRNHSVEMIAEQYASLFKELMTMKIS